MKLKRTFLCVLWCLMTATALAEPITNDRIPRSLRSWIPWVLHEHPDVSCPYLYNNYRTHRCAWPGRLELDLSAKQGQFTAAWFVDAESWITLPGEEKVWPQRVTVDDERVAVVKKQGRPVVKLRPGRYQIKGQFVWNAPPQSLAVAKDTALIRLTVDGRTIDEPNIDKQGRVWLRAGQSASQKSQTDTVDLRVYRRVIDDVPMRIVTHLDFKVSGKQRELLIDGAVLPDAVPLALTSTLAARLENDNRLRVLLKPGNWQVQLESRQSESVTEISLPAFDDPWPASEVWVFEAKPELRMVEVVEQTSIDPRTTNLPPDWRNLPAYRMRGGDTFAVNVIRRGNPELEPNALNMQKTVWLDFDGEGFTVNDQITGSLTSGWRLNAHAETQLGQVMVSGVPQFITRLPGQAEMGVELRQGQVQLSADSRIEQQTGELNAVGWNADFQSARTVLNLPPGWRLFSVSGVDNVPNTWISQWNLLDLFMVLVIVLVVRSLWGNAWGIAALFMLVAMWHEPGAPRYVWLNILVAVALLRVIPAGRIQRMVSMYRWLAVGVLLMISVVFIADQVRLGLYPQLEKPQYRVAAMRPQLAPAGGMVMSEADQALSMPAEQVRKEGKNNLSSKPSSLPAPATSPKYRAASSQTYAEVDPDMNVQTGPGLPDWRWSSYTLDWNGPVNRQQTVDLWLQSPSQTLALNVLRVMLLIGGIALVLLRSPGTSVAPKEKTVAPMAVLWLLVPMLGLVPELARAEYPTPVLLEELEKRLLEAPECVPQCAQIPGMTLGVAGNELMIEMTVHAQDFVAVPLPARVGEWVPTQIRVDDKPPAGVFRTEQGQIWIKVSPGEQRVRLHGRLPNRSSLSLPLPLRPHRVETSALGWSVSGVGRNGYPENQLKLSRAQRPTELPQDGLNTLAPQALPPFLTVTRTLKLGLEWRVSTVVQRVSPTGQAVVVDIPLLTGESVISSGASVTDGQVSVSLLPDQMRYRWDSVLNVTDKLHLVAPDTVQWVEVWRADVSPIWHMASTGIPVIFHQDRQGHRLPEWRPWSGESVQLTLTRPEGTEGNTVTIDRSELRVSPGKRATDATLEMIVRSSQGGRLPVTLPVDAQLQAVAVNGEPHPNRLVDNTVVLPLVPGEQTFELRWQNQSGIAAWFETPAVNVFGASVNHTIRTELGRDRWVLFTGGPPLGPAVLFWGVLIVVVLVGVALGFVPLTPIKSWQWVLLGVGLSQLPVWSAMIVVLWLLALGWRYRLAAETSAFRFNVVQVGLAVLTLVSLALLFNAIRHGLLGLPEMQIAGNQSDAYHLNWYQDRALADLPQAWVLSVPLMVYRLLMLVWALWLAHSLIRWLRWGWVGYSTQGLWRKMDLGLPSKRKSEADEASEQTE